MRRALLALAVLTTLFAAQNGLAIAPVPARDAVVPQMVVRLDASGLVAEPGDHDAEAPAPSTMALLFAGLAGLTIAGTRRPGTSGEAAKASA